MPAPVDEPKKVKRAGRPSPFLERNKGNQVAGCIIMRLTEAMRGMISFSEGVRQCRSGRTA